MPTWSKTQSYHHSAEYLFYGTDPKTIEVLAQGNWITCGQVITRKRLCIYLPVTLKAWSHSLVFFYQRRWASQPHKAIKNKNKKTVFPRTRYERVLSSVSPELDLCEVWMSLRTQPPVLLLRHSGGIYATILKAVLRKTYSDYHIHSRQVKTPVKFPLPGYSQKNIRRNQTFPCKEMLKSF